MEASRITCTKRREARVCLRWSVLDGAQYETLSRKRAFGSEEQTQACEAPALKRSTLAGGNREHEEVSDEIVRRYTARDEPDTGISR